MRKFLLGLLSVSLLSVLVTGCSPHVPNRYEIIGDSNLENSQGVVNDYFHLRADADQLDIDAILGFGACPSHSAGDPNLPGTYWSQRLPELRDGWSSTKSVALVVMLGANDLGDAACSADYASAMDLIVNAARWDRVFWLNQRTDGAACLAADPNPCAASNAQEDAYAQTHSGVVILDYAAHFNGHPEWFFTDTGGPPGGNVHLNATGSGELAHWLRDQLDAQMGGHDTTTSSSSTTSSSTTTTTTTSS